MSYPEPRYLAEAGEHSGVLRTADTPTDLSMASGTQVHYLGTGGSTNGAFGLYRWEMGPRPSGPGAHFHRTMTESFYVLSGTIRLFNGEKWAEGRPGDFLFVPEGGVHAFRNESGEPASMLILFTPGAPREAYFEELADISNTGRQLGPEEWTELFLRHDQYMV
ncbi:cupin domain-containing protein [Nonomuraea angiospora]|uniref:Quercetin dioxygenase-like cupin family protein n=1 Tax=Nonomuraea angiospora TaxID=46172 RepID=A0ABR9M9T3_9ACTN|nr:cupin domain-containing protein [Nonomuraea angiospora]MBE1589303.1 quercetin dioxygenase-like cupin family protein [Nonomuraea angiospora]